MMGAWYWRPPPSPPASAAGLHVHAVLAIVALVVGAVASPMPAGRQRRVDPALALGSCALGQQGGGGGAPGERLGVQLAEHLGHLPRTLVLRLDVEVLDERVLQKRLDLVSVHDGRVERLQRALEKRQRLVARVLPAPIVLHG